MSRWFESYGFAEVYPDLVIGAYPLDTQDAAALGRLPVARVLNLVEDSEYGPGVRDEVEWALESEGIEETRLRLVDFGHLPSDELEEAVTTVVGWLKQDGRNYVHCRAGWQRSASVAAGAIAVREGIHIQQALNVVQTRKPSANPLPHQRRDLVDWWAQRGAVRID